MKSVYCKTLYLLHLFVYLQLISTSEPLKKEDPGSSSLEVMFSTSTYKNLTRTRRGFIYTIIKDIKDSIINPSPRVKKTVLTLVVPNDTSVLPGLVKAIGKALTGFLQLSTKTIEEVQLNVKLIHVKVNLNYENAVQLKEITSRKNSNAESLILLFKDGVKCDKSFCSKQGIGRYLFGVCSPYICACNEDKVTGFKCPEDEIFDPVYQTCDAAIKVKLCGE